VNTISEILAIHVKQNSPGQTIFIIHYIKDSDVKPVLGREINVIHPSEYLIPQTIYKSLINFNLKGEYYFIVR
jgi:hypothetical protein